MMNREEVKMVLEMLLDTPDMEIASKVSGKLTRKAMLLLSTVIEMADRAQGEGEKSPNLLAFLPPEVLEELKIFSETILQEAKLVSTSDNLKKILASK